MQSSHSTKTNRGIKQDINASNGRSIASIVSENIQMQLEEARFISGFMADICTSLERDDICSIAARALYAYTPYYRVVFTFSTELGGKTITFSPLVQKGILAAKAKVSARKPGSIPNDSSLASAHLNLLDNMGTIAIYFKAGQHKIFSDSLLTNMTTCFGQALKNALEHGRMKDLAMRDGLTELFNRRTFDETLAQKVKHPDMRPISLLIIDLDNFKQVNDTFGHQAGDQVLKTVARILKESCRGQDLVARFGGEEFAIILAQTKAVTAHAIAQRIRNRLAKTAFTFDERQLQMTASIGLATCQDGTTLSTVNLVKQADRALYHAKRNGKNRVSVFPADLLADTTYSCDIENANASFVPACC